MGLALSRCGDGCVGRRATAATGDEEGEACHAPEIEVTARIGQALIVRAGTRACAVPVHDVVETMRPLPIEPLAGVPRFVCGVSVVRGAPIPVLDLDALLEGDDATMSYGRFVMLKLGERRAVLGVDEVIGLRNLDSANLEDLPPLLESAGRDCIEALGAEDAELLVSLRAVRLVPDEVWAALAAKEGR